MATVTGTKRLLDISGNNITTAVSLEAEGTLLDSNGTSGTSGQLLSSTGTGVDWVSNNSGSWDGIFSGSAQITGSLGVTGSVLVDGNVGIGNNNPVASIDIVETSLPTTGDDYGVLLDMEKSSTTTAYSVNAYGLRSHVKSTNTGTNQITNLNALWTKAEHTGTGPTYFIIGSSNRGYHNGSGNTGGIYGAFNEVKVLGTGTGTHPYVIGANIAAELTNANATITNLQGSHISVKQSAGTVTGTQALLLDYDMTGGSVTGDLAYLRIQNDTITTTVGGTARAINSLSTLPSVFAGNMGIGTTSPSAKLDVRTANGNTNSLRIGRIDAASYWDFNHAGNDLRIYNNGGTGQDILLGVNAAGTIYDNKVGIGTATPGYKLDVNGTARVNGVLTIPGIILHDGDVGTSIGFSGNDTIALSTNGSTKLEINSLGQTAITGVLSVGTDTFNSLGISSGLTGTTYTTNANGLGSQPDIFFKTGVNTRLKINGVNGNVGIGSITTPEKLTIEGNVSASGDFIGTNFTGSSFTGSFVGDGSGLTDTPINITAGTALTFTGDTLNVSTAGLSLGSANIPSSTVNRNYVIQHQNNAAQTLVVNVPWTDTSWDGIYSGSAQITGSLGVTGSIESLTDEGFNIWQIGVPGIKNLNTDENWGLTLDPEEGLIFTDGTGDSTGKSIYSANSITLQGDYDQEINSTSPAAVIKNTNQNGSGLNIWAANGGGGTNTILKLGTSSETVKMVVIENGNVGIGTTNPGEKLQVDLGLFVVGDSSVSEQLVLGFDYLGGELGIYKKDTDELIAGMYENNYVYGSDPYNPYLFITGSNGNVGIGTTSPGEQLEVNGNVKADTLIATDLTDGVIPYHRNGSFGLQDQKMFSDNTNIYIGPASTPNYYSRLTVEGTGISTTDIKISGSLTYQEPTAASEFNGEIATFGTFIETPAAGDLICFNNTGLGTGNGWREANNSTTLDATGMLGIAVGTTPTSGILLRGFARSALYNTTNLGTTPAGKKLYIDSTNGLLTTVIPTSNYVRIVGYVVEADATDGTIYFCPDNTYIDI